MVGWWFEDMYDFAPIEYAGELHQLIVAGTGGGKFTTGIATTLLGSRLDDSTVVVVDPKGEIAQLAGPYFQKALAEKATVHLLDPWDLCGTGQTSVLNVIDQIDRSNPNHVDDARALADAMVIPSGGENTHWVLFAFKFGAEAQDGRHTSCWHKPHNKQVEQLPT